MALIKLAGQETLTRYCAGRRRSRPHIARRLPRHRHEDGNELENLDLVGGPASRETHPGDSAASS